jgi:hypothetical protein
VTFHFFVFSLSTKKKATMPIEDFARRSSAARLPGQSWSVLDLDSESQSLAKSDEDDAFVARVMQSWATISPADLTTFCVLFGIREDLFDITHQDEQYVVVTDTDDTAMVRLYPHREYGFYDEPCCLLRPLDMLEALKPAHVVAANGWDDPTRLARCLAHWDDRALVSEEDVAWCMQRNDVPRECYMRVSPHWPNKFLVGSELHFFKIVLDPAAHSFDLVAMWNK